jgi:hypothetical protein
MEFRKLTANDVEARVQSCDENGFTLLLYKNARCDMNILDETVGAENWQREHYECKGNLFCRVGIKCDDKQHQMLEWVWKADCGTESNTEKEKGESSDSFKRACFNWGIGRELYTSPKTKIKGNTKQIKRNGKDVWVPTYYAFDVVEMEVTDDKPRRITALTIIGKSMEGGYHEDEIFSWTDKKPTPKQKPMVKDEPKEEPKATPNQIEILKKTYKGANLTKLLKANNITAIEDMPMAKASEIISKLKKKVEGK